MRTGTHHFESRGHAINYYRANGHGPYAAMTVAERLSSGDIAIGAPALTPGQSTSVDADGRYWIEG